MSNTAHTQPLKKDITLGTNQSVCTTGDGFTPYRVNIKIGEKHQDDPPHQHHQSGHKQAAITPFWIYL